MNWYYDLKTVHKMWVIAILSAVSLMLVGLTGFYFAGQNAHSMQTMYKDRLLPIQWLNECRTHLRANEANLLTVIASSDPKEKQDHVDKIKERSRLINENLDKYKNTKLDPFEVEELKNLDKLIVDFRTKRETIIELAMNDNQEEAYSAFQLLDGEFDALNKSFIALANYNSDVAKRLSENGMKDATYANIIILIISLLAITATTWLAVHTGNRIFGILSSLGSKMNSMANGDLTIEKMGRCDNSCIGDMTVTFDKMLDNLNNLIKEVIASSDEIAAGSQQLYVAAEQTAEGANQVATSVGQMAEGSQEQATSVANSLGNVNEMSQAVQKIANNAQTTVELSQETEHSADEGKHQADNAVKKINEIKSTATEVSGTINTLGKLSAEIEQIVDLIKGIASQTNLLALNAAIEAARAGEHGKGFAVVAEEVKKLAGQSATATEKITQMIKEIQSKTKTAVTAMDSAVNQVDEGVSIVESTGKALLEILTAAKKTSEQIEEISAEVENLSAGSENVVRMMENISAVTEESSATTEEIASITEEQTASVEEITASAQSLAKVADNLKSQVAKFKIN